MTAITGPLATLALGLFLTGALIACGAGTERSNPQSRLSVAHSPREVRAGSAPDTRPRGYLNDSDHDRSGDSDNDNSLDTDDDASQDYRISDNTSYHESDDGGIVAYGHSPSARESQLVTTLVESYYAAAAAGKGAKACSMLLGTFARTVPNEYGGASGPPYLRGLRTCAAVVTRQFERFRSRLSAAFTVTAVRVDGNQAFALLGSRTAPASYLPLQRKHDRWWIVGLSGTALP